MVLIYRPGKYFINTKPQASNWVEFFLIAFTFVELLDQEKVPSFLCFCDCFGLLCVIIVGYLIKVMDPLRRCARQFRQKAPLQSNSLSTLDPVPPVSYHPPVSIWLNWIAMSYYL